MGMSVPHVGENWRIHVREDIERNSSIFKQEMERCKHLYRNKHYEDAAAHAEAVAMFAWLNPIGEYSAPELEELLITIGKQHCSGDSVGALTRSPQGQTKILHVVTQAYTIGGHTRLVWRWIRHNSEFSHSVALTQQGRNRLPKQLIQAVSETHGKVFRLDQSGTNLLDRARMLRNISLDEDIVILHIHPHDSLPLLAFANADGIPPIIFLNHADHVFWLGASISNVIANIRESAQRISIQWRGVAEQHNKILPIPLTIAARTYTRENAKAQLGLPADCVFLLSVASGYKFARLSEDLDFVDAHLPVLAIHPNVHFYVIGPDGGQRWQRAHKLTSGRFQALGERQDIQLFLQAADVYIDSFPFASLTSVLEAGSYGLPIVSLQLSDNKPIACQLDDPALMNLIQYSRGIGDHQNVISRLIMDPSLRSTIGQTTQEALIQYHGKEGWRTFMQATYKHALSSERIDKLHPQKGSSIYLGDELLMATHKLGKVEKDFEILLITRLPLFTFRMRYKEIFYRRLYMHREFLWGLLPATLRKAHSFLKRQVKKSYKSILVQRKVHG